MAENDGYSRDLDRFLQGWEQVQKDMQQQDRLDELAARVELALKQTDSN